MKKAIFLLVSFALFFCLAAFTDVAPGKYTNFTGKETDFSVCSYESNIWPNRLDEEVKSAFKKHVQYKDKSGLFVLITVSEQAANSYSADTAKVRTAFENNGQQKPIKLDYNGSKLTGFKNGKTESFLLIPDGKSIIIIEFMAPEENLFVGNGYKSKRNSFLAQYTNHIKSKG